MTRTTRDQQIVTEDAEIKSDEIEQETPGMEIEQEMQILLSNSWRMMKKKGWENNCS